MARGTVAVVTDSTAGLPDALVSRYHLTVVPLTVTIGGTSGREGVDVAPADVAKALEGPRATVTTSRPSPGEFAAAYARLLDAGAPGIVSVHLSAKLSGTQESARLAAAEFPGRVAVVDSQSTGMGLGFCALAAAGTRDLDAARAAALAAVRRTTTLFYGGRASQTTVWVGTRPTAPRPGLRPGAALGGGSSAAPSVPAGRRREDRDRGAAGRFAAVCPPRGSDSDDRRSPGVWRPKVP